MDLNLLSALVKVYQFSSPLSIGRLFLPFDSITAVSSEYTAKFVSSLSSKFKTLFSSKSDVLLFFTFCTPEVYKEDSNLSHSGL